MSTYIMSDIHGNLTKFIKLLQKIKYEPEVDKLYILGNVIDDGPQPIDLLKVIMSDTSMNMCLGRHEIAMIQSFVTKDFEVLDKWRTTMGGEVTYEQYMKESESERFRILDYLSNRPLFFSDEHIVLVSAGFLVNEQPEGAIQKEFEETLKTQIENTLYWIGEEFYTRPAFHDRVTFFGATPVQHIRKSKDFHIWHDAVNKDKICVNTGVNIKPYKLGCICLETLDRNYV